LETARSKAVGSQAPHPLEHSFLPLLAWIGERLKERLIAVRAADVFGRPATSMHPEAGVDARVPRLNRGSALDSGVRSPAAVACLG